MKKNLLLRVLLPVVFTLHLYAGKVSAQTTPQFYNFNTGTTTNTFPFQLTDRRIQWLYTANEFTGAYSGNITRIYFRSAISVTNATYTNFIVRMGHTTLSAFSSATYITPLTTVISSATYVIPTVTASGWVGLTLQTPFAYDNTKNLIIEVIQTTAANGWTILNTTTTARRIYGGNSTATVGINFDASQANFGFDVKKNSFNDAGIASIDSPYAFCPGIRNIVATVKNFGRNNISGVTINWRLDGTLQTPITYNTTLDTLNNSSAMITLGSLNFVAGVSHTIKAWTSDPNGVADTTKGNDTSSVTVKPSISGSYTIGGTTPDYNTISAAVADLNAYGICGPVDFTIRAGTYNEQVSIDQIPGASSVNTITFDGVNATTRTITFAGTATNPHTLKLDGSDHVTVKNLTIINTASTNAFTVHITNQADSNTISNCMVRGSTTATLTTSIALGIMGATYATAGNHGNYNTISGCTIEGGYATVVFYGTSLASPADGNTLLNCNLSGAYTYGVYSYYQGGNNYLGNTVVLRSGTNASYGIYCVNNTDGFKVERNKVKSYTYGLYFSSCNTTGSLRASVANNIVWGQATATPGQIYCTTLTNSDIYHNTTYNTAAGGYGLYMTGGSGNMVRNNIFMKTMPNSYCAYISTVAPLADMDYNNYYSTVSGNFVYIAASYTTLASLKTLTAYNQNSISALPNFVSTTSGSEDFHLTAGVPAPYGLNLGITNDVDDDPRCLFAPSLGADESKYIVLAPVAGFILPDSIWVNSPFTILNSASANEAKSHSWYLGGVKISSTMNLVYTFGSAGTDSLKLVTQSCGGIDSITKVITIFNPTRVPESDFVSDKNQIAAYENVKFTDLSVNGASSWSWSVIPANGVTIVNANSQNPVMSFSLPGDYRVCLIASNGLGAGNTECKNAYIRVGDVEYMCSAPFISNASLGTIYDSGGPLTNYANNENCSFLIDPCATSVTLKFDVFSLGNVGDELKIYDGSSASTGVLLGTFTSTSGTPGGNAGLTANTGKMLLVWKTDAATLGTGFDANWTSVPASYAKPIASFTMVDTAYVNQPVIFQSTTTGVYLNYSWDVDAPNFTPGDNGGLMDNEIFTYTAPGTYFISLTVNNCGGLDTLTKMLVVVDPTTPPYPVDFKIDISRLTLQDTAQLTDISGHGASSWFWSANPSTGIKFLPNNTVYNPKVVASLPGIYDIKLVVSNSIGSDSLTKFGFIRVVSYCIPGVANLNNDAGISNVKIIGSNNTIINNGSSIGVTGYTDYTQTSQKVTLELGENYDLEVKRNTTNNKMNRKFWLDYNGDGDFNDVGEEVASESSAQTDTWNVSFNIPGSATIGYSRFRIGTNLNNLPNNPCGPNAYGEFEDYRVVITSDITLPVILLAGADTVYIEQYRAYVDAGATALDNLNGNISADMYANPNTVATANTTIAGTHILTFNVTDSAGNAAVQKTRTVIVSPDSTRPFIVLNGSSPMIVQVGTGFADPGATATDFRSTGNVPVSFGSFSNVDTTVIGIYSVTYTATDASGNFASVVRIVEVTDTVKPTVLLVGSDTVYVEVKTTFIDPMVTAFDNYYPVSGLSVVSDAATAVNMNVIGSYVVTYSVTDGSGNVTIITRIVIVVDTEKPLVVLLGLPIELVEVHSASFNDPGATVTDNYDNLTYMRSGTVDLTLIGDYPLRYFAVDASGNLSDTVDRIVRVQDTQKPVITLRGDEFVYVERWAPYIDSGAIVDDNYYKNLTAIATFTGNTLKEGIFYVHYDITDPSGNIAKRVSRKVLVGANTSGIASQNTGGLQLYPNPSQGYITISIDNESPMIAEVYNMMGALVQTFNSGGVASKRLEFDMSSNADGVYYIRVQAGEQVFTRKMLLSK